MNQERCAFDEVYGVELEEIRRRRQVAGDQRPLPPAYMGKKSEAAPEPDARHGLVGLAFSGGPLR